VVNKLVDVTSKVVHGIADAVTNAVNWVVERVKSCLGIESAAPAQTRMAPTATALTVEDAALEEDEPPASAHPSTPEAAEAPTIDTEVVEPEGAESVEVEAVQPETAEADVVAPEVTETVEPEVAEPETPAAPTDDVIVEPAEEAETAPVTPRTAPTTTTRTVKTAKSPKTAASGGVR
jgi:hypothetical protein